MNSDSQNSLRLAAGAAAIALTTSHRLIRNFRYYRNIPARKETKITVYKDDMAKLCRAIRQDVYGLHNLMEQEKDAVFLVSLAGQIYDQLEELHRNLLFFDAEAISEIIPLVDQQRKFWENLTDTEFYSYLLTDKLENSIPHSLEKIESLIGTLPDSTVI